MHLVILVHGMWGNIRHFDYIVQQLESAGAASLNGDPAVPADCALAVYCTRSNEGYFTYDGVDICGLRVANEISSVIDSVAAQDVKVSQLSIVGYSMGGPISRYAIGLLDLRGLFDRVEPNVFMTVCSPHVGANILSTSLSARLFNSIGTWSMARTSRQVFLRDHAQGKTPLFLLMTDPATPWARALRRFRRRALYANVVNDRRCSFYTAAVESEDPYALVDIRSLEGPFVAGYEPVVLASTQPRFAAGAAAPPPRKSGLLRWLLARARRAGKFAMLALQIGVIAPLWFVAFSINATYQFFASRLRTHSILRSGLHAPKYDLSALLEDQAEDIVEDVYSTVQRRDGHQKLALTPVMRKLEDQFNAQGWEKYPICIKETAQAHAAAIVRHPGRQSFWEGRIVVQHITDLLLSI